MFEFVRSFLKKPNGLVLYSLLDPVKNYVFLHEIEAFDVGRKVKLYLQKRFCLKKN